jgi:hypothetical protein
MEPEVAQILLIDARAVLGWEQENRRLTQLIKIMSPAKAVADVPDGRAWESESRLVDLS